MHPWRAWYPGGETVNSSVCEPEDLPDGLLGVVEYLPFETPKRYRHTGHDLYFWWEGPEGPLIGGNSDSRAENERRYPGCVQVRGRWTTHEHMREVQEAMNAAQEPPV